MWIKDWKFENFQHQKTSCCLSLMKFHSNLHSLRIFVFSIALFSLKIFENENVNIHEGYFIPDCSHISNKQQLISVSFGWFYFHFTSLLLFISFRLWSECQNWHNFTWKMIRTSDSFWGEKRKHENSKELCQFEYLCVVLKLPAKFHCKLQIKCE